MHAFVAEHVLWHGVMTLIAASTITYARARASTLQQMCSVACILLNRLHVLDPAHVAACDRAGVPLFCGIFAHVVPPPLLAG